ncbi:MAG: glycosyltransferase [Acidobacteriota bacterium]|nr:glycosyltransferase [Acidobacteriota bacterium]MDH3783718.1 glycosyltransferase [Acidobacteriota bacterium]
MEWVFWILAALLVYLHGGYALILVGLVRLRGSATKRPSADPDNRVEDWPAVTILIGAYNEEAVLAAKLDSLLAQDYRGTMRLLVVSDRSSDGTDDLARRYADRGVELYVAPRRLGKAANFSAIVGDLTSEVVVCTDAAGSFASDVVRLLVRRLDDPRAGMVGGRIFYSNVDATGVSRGEGLYWRFEVLLRTLESRLGGTVIVSGACYAIRRTLFRPVVSAFPDDFMSPLNVIDQGFRVLYEPRARIEESVATTVSGEFRTKTRIISRNAAALWSMRRLLNPFRGPGAVVKLLSHRLLRWLVAPMLLAALTLNILLAGQPFYGVFLIGQVLFYALALLGLVPAFRRRRLIFIPFYFCLVNLAASFGLFRALRGRISGVWEPVEREDGP